MAWIDKRGRYRLRARIKDAAGKKKTVTVIEDLGQWKGAAETVLVNFRRALPLGFVYVPPIEVAEVNAFLKAKADGLDSPNQDKRIAIEELCDLYLLKHGPSLKGGASVRWNASYYNLRCRLAVIKRAWAGKYGDEIHMLDVRDFLATKDTVGTRMRYLGTITHMFKSLGKWNKRGILQPRLRLPAENPGTEWRAEMTGAQKREIAHTRVLSPEEWNTFKVELSARARAICEIALRRFLRLADIRKICAHSITNGMIGGEQQKTGDPYSVPVIANQPHSYDFTNFRKEFTEAQVRAKMYYPNGHPMRFTVKDLRRTGATWAYRDTKDLVAVSEMLGHTNTLTTRRYLNITETDKLRIAEAVDRLANAESGSTGGAEARN